MNSKQNISTKKKGLYAILPHQVEIWESVISEIRGLLMNTGYQQCMTALGEGESLFSKPLLRALNIVDKKSLFVVRRNTKDSFVFTSPGPVSILKTAIDQNLYDTETVAKLYQYGMTLVDDDSDDATEPQQMHVFKVESVGDIPIVRKAELILTAYRILEELGYNNLIVSINALGGRETQSRYYDALCERAQKRHSQLCKDFVGHHPSKLYSSLMEQSEDMAINLPHIVDYLTEEESKEFQATLEFLDTLGIPYEMDSQLSGSLGFGEGIYFEITSQDIPNSIVIRGGDHSEIAKVLGADSEVGAIGMEIYVDSIVQSLWKERSKGVKSSKPQVFVASIGQEGQKSALKVLSMIQKNGLGVKESFGLKSLRQQLVKAKKSNAQITVIVGRKEAIDGTAIVREQVGENQETVPIEQLLQVLERKLTEK